MAEALILDFEAANALARPTGRRVLAVFALPSWTVRLHSKPVRCWLG